MKIISRASSTQNTWLVKIKPYCILSIQKGMM